MKRLQALKVLLVEDNQGDVLLLRTALDADQLSTFELTTVDLLEDGLRQLQQTHFDIALVDLGLPDSLGLQTFERVHRASPEMPVVVFSGNEDEEQAVDAVRLGAQDYLVKSLSGFDMAARTIRYAIERNKLHNNLRESEERFSILFHSNPIPMGITRASDYSIVDVNDVWTNLTGYTRDEALGHTAAELGLVKPETLQQVRNKLAELGEIHQLEIPFYNRNGEERLVSISSESLVLGREAYVLNNLLDITERKRLEESQRESEQKYTLLFQKSAVPTILIKLPEVVVFDANEAYETLTGYTRQEMFGKTSVELGLFKPEQRKELVARFDREGGLIGREGRLYSRNGQEHIVVMNTTPVQIGGKMFAITTMQDITERKQAERQVIQLKRLYATLSQVNQTIVRVKDHANLYQSICDVSTKFGEFALAWIGLLNEATGDITPVAASGLDLAQWPFPQINIYEDTFKNGLIATALLTSKVVTSEDIKSDERTKSFQASLEKYDYHAAAIVPFQLRGKTIGVLGLVSRDTESFKSEEEVALLKEMGGDISFALDTMETEAERIKAEKKIEKQNERLTVLRKIDLAILSADSLESIVSAALAAYSRTDRLPPRQSDIN
jgi:PAS domain S-box-containing protein